MAEPYCFGRFTVDPAERRLCADGVPVPLGATDFRLLLALVERAGAIVAKDDLMSLVGGRAPACDNVLYIHINALRKVLGSNCIENQQGRGYRFVAPVRRTEPHTPQPHLEVCAGNLPWLWTGDAPGGPTRLIGRAVQLRLVAGLLANGRLVTLTGHGGVGKTRLALQAASEDSSQFSDGVWLVELSTLKDADMVAGAVSSVLGVKIGARATPLDALSRYLSRKSLLIVLDNCEHLIASSAQVSESILAAAPGVKILATSREALSCCAEQVLEVPPLAVPSEGAMPPAAMREVPAINLFIERAVEADANFQVHDAELPIVARICRRVDGLPLAIEMAAGWAGLLGLERLDARLDGSLKAWLRARSTAPPRHSTIRATLEWSHALLSTAEQSVLARLAVFAGSFSMEAAEAVAGDDIIPRGQVFECVASLVRKSMIAAAPGPHVQRYRLLETTRAFMLEVLAASGEGNVTRLRHARHVLCMLEQATGEWETTSDAVWLEHYGPMLDDLRAALDWAMIEACDDAVALAGASWPLWRELSLRAEGKQRLSAAAARLHPDTPPALEARLRCGLGDMLLNTAATKAAYVEIECAANLYRAHGDPHLGCALTWLGYALLMLDRTEEAERAITEALSLLESVGWLRTLAAACSNQLCIEATLGRFDAARAAGEKATYLCEMAGFDRTALLVAANLVQLYLEKGNLDRAISAGRSAVDRLQDTPHSGIRGFVLGVLAAALTARGDLDQALTAAREAAPFLRDEGRLFWLFDHLALRAVLTGRARDAALIAGYANAVYQKFDRPRETMGRHAMERTTWLLREALPEAQITQLNRVGAQLSEDQATSIALGT